MSSTEIVLSLAAGALGGFINTLASSGSAVTLPLLVFLGLPAGVANGTNRIGVLAGALAGALSFHRAGVIQWGAALRLSLPTGLGALVGSAIAGALSEGTMQWVIRIAVVVAFAMILCRPGRWLLRPGSEASLRLGWPQMAMFFLIGWWAGFIVLDSATYALIGLTLAVGYDLIHANAVKAVLLAMAVLASLLVFAADAEVQWPIGLVMALGSMLGSWLAARMAVQEWSKIWVYRLLVVVVLGEVVHLAPTYRLMRMVLETVGQLVVG